jgi:hypothetical protein
MDLETFHKKFEVEPSLSRNAFLAEDGVGISFDTTGADHEFVLSLVKAGKENFIWSIRENEEGFDSDDEDEDGEPEDFDTHFLGAGYGKVNVAAYIVTKKPWSDADLSLEIPV